MPTLPIASLIPTGQEHHPLLLTVRLGCQLALPIADIDPLDRAGSHGGSAGVEGVLENFGHHIFRGRHRRRHCAGHIGLRLLEPASGAVFQRDLRLCSRDCSGCGGE